jgi:hypothetical protein
MKKIELFCLGIFFLCIFQKGVSQVIYAQNMAIPNVYSIDSQIYMCSQYTVSYPKKSEFGRYKKREVCSCHQTTMNLIEWKKNRYATPETYGRNTFIILDKDFIFNYILPLIRDEDEREIIEYTLANSDKSTFKNIIDSNNKIVINDKMYYYHLNISTCISINYIDYDFFISLVPKSSWIYEPDCFDIGKGMLISLLIPLLEVE